MSYSPYEIEFYLKINRECQHLMDKCYAMISQLDHYENDCGFEFPGHVKKFKAKLFNMLKTYEENNL
jgi:hypothetical protein